VKAKLQKETVQKLVEQKKKSDKVEFDSSLMTVDEFADCYKAAESLVEHAKTDPKENLPEGQKDAK